jgi:LacI family transcriptional regulator
MKKKYIELAEQIKEFILSRNLTEGERLPSEKNLAEIFIANHVTIRKALAVLEAEGVIHKIPSRGNFVGKGRLKKNRSGLIGVLIPEKDPFFFDMLTALESRLNMFGYAPVLQISQRSPAREIEAMKKFAALGVEGIIATPNKECRELYLDPDIPLIFFDNMIDGAGVPYVLNDDFQAAISAVEHLISLGHSRIAYIGGFGDHSSTQRHNGYRAALKKHAVAIRPEFICPREYSREWGYSAARELFEHDTVPTAVFCGNDSIAAGLLRYLMTHGIQCPGRVSVIGCCNAPFSEDIGLTTVDQQTEKLAETLWQILHTVINGGTAPPAVLMPSRLLLRRTTGVCTE